MDWTINAALFLRRDLRKLPADALIAMNAGAATRADYGETASIGPSHHGKIYSNTIKYRVLPVRIDQ
ncbi:MAG: hypothetical protein QF541_03515 [Lentisphaeria bacterium]|nr:hypothetical protein [Lentisphaeria bacterium]